MCGISGIICKNPHLYKSNIIAMNNALHHRGPDSNGYIVLKGAILGHTRLEIIDIDGGSQPMISNDRRYAVTFNGEIYGYKDLKKNLNYSFKTESDTELLLALFHQKKESILNGLPGMFAFAVWDQLKLELYLARDRFGEKPLYYCFGSKGEFIFASEIKAIIASGLIEPKVSINAIGNFLKNLHVNYDETIYENIKQLKPSTCLKLKGGKLSHSKYYDFPATREISLADALPEFKNKFEAAVKKQMISDVEVGAFLSGGLDSSSVVSVAKKFNSDIKTFSFGLDDKNNEIIYAKSIADNYALKNYSKIEKEIDVETTLLKIPEIYDEPFADSSSILTLFLCQFASEYVKVILTGDGADELLAGYNWWYSPLIGIGKKNSLYKEILYRVMGKYINHYYSEKASRMHAGRVYNSYKDAYLNRKGFFNENDIFEITGIKNTIDYGIGFHIEENLNDVLKFDLSNHLSGDILCKIDRASMANSLELRSPFLDYEFANFCISLPSSLKINESETKIILRKAYADKLTNEVNKRKKQGFGAPINRWLKHPKLNDLKGYYFSKDRKIFSLLNFEKCKPFFQVNNYKTWAILNLSIWFESKV